MTPAEIWSSAIAEKRELEEAHALARVALRIEYDLTGDCDATSALCDALGIPVDATDG